MALRGNFIALNAYSRKKSRSQLNDLSFLLKKLKIGEQTKSKQRKRY